MNLTRELVVPFLAGNPDDVAKNSEFRNILKNLKLISGAPIFRTVEETNAIDQLKLFFGEDKLIELLAEINRFDILVDRNFYIQLISEGKYLEEIYMTIRKLMPIEFQSYYLSRFCTYGQMEFLAANREYSAIAMSARDEDIEYLLRIDKAHYLILFAPVKKIDLGANKGFTYEAFEKELFDKVYKAKGVSPFRTALWSALRDKRFSTFWNIINFLFSVEDFEYLEDNHQLRNKVKESIIVAEPDEKLGISIYFYNFHKRKENKKAMRKLRSSFSVFSSAYWQFGKRKWRNYSLSEMKEAFKKK